MLLKNNHSYYVKVSMLYHLSLYLKNSYSFFNVMHYVSFRAMAALLTSLLFSFTFGTWFIDKSKQFFRSKARSWTPETHKLKDDMPTMGGIFILATVLFSSVLWCNLAHYEVWIFLFCLLGFGIIGFLDDWFKIKGKKGLYARTKFALQLFVATTVAVLLFLHDKNITIMSVPFFKNFHIDTHYFFIFWIAFILVAMSNAVNLTDGLDGLAIGSLIPNFALYSLICYIAGHFLLASYLHIPYAHSSEITIIGTTLLGASLGFLWYNTYPAQIFMGDVGSLALGSGLALMAIMAKQELLLLISGGLFVIETVSVIMQVISFKLLGKRIFRMAPIHHHFELLGWQESKITVRFGIISLILCLIALMTLKIR
jgi:phospho-N-acetylmuramoyl-pentapeptide-transferase